METARQRGEEARALLLRQSGPVLTVDEVAAFLGTSREDVELQRAAGRLIAFPVQHVHLYPSWQFGAGGLLPALVDVLKSLGVRDPWMQGAFFLNRNSLLGGASPLAELRRGRIDAVRRAARAYGEQGAA